MPVARAPIREVLVLAAVWVARGRLVWVLVLPLDRVWVLAREVPA